MPRRPDVELLVNGNITDKTRFKFSMDIAYRPLSHCAIKREDYLHLLDSGRKIGLSDIEMKEIELEITSEYVIIDGFGVA